MFTEQRTAFPIARAVPDCADHDAMIHGSIARPAAEKSAAVGHRPLQPALQLLHARSRVRLAAAPRHPAVRRDEHAGRRVRAGGRRSRPAHRRRAAAAARFARADPDDRAQARDPRSGADDQRRDAGRPGARAARGGPASADGEPRHAAARSLSGAHPVRLAAAGARRHRRSGEAISRASSSTR